MKSMKAVLCTMGVTKFKPGTSPSFTYKHTVEHEGMSSSVTRAHTVPCACRAAAAGSSGSAWTLCPPCEQPRCRNEPAVRDEVLTGHLLSGCAG